MAITAFSQIPQLNFENTYVPLEMPKELMLYTAQQQQKQYDTAQVAAEDLSNKLIVEGGLQTQQLSKKITEDYSKKLNDIVSDPEFTANPSKGLRRLVILKNDFLKNPYRQIAEKDKEVSNIVKSKLLTPEGQRAAKPWMTESGITQKDENTALLQDPSTWYNLEPEESFRDSFKDIAAAIPKDIREVQGDPTTVEVYEGVDANGNPIYASYKKNKNTTIEDFSRDYISKKVDPYFKSGAYKEKQNIRYRSALGDIATEDPDAIKEQFLNEFSEMFYKRTKTDEKETRLPGTMKSSKPGDKGAGSYPDPGYVSFTGIGGTTTKIEPQKVTENIKNYDTQINEIDKNINSTEDPYIKNDLTKEKNNLEYRKRLSENVLKSLEEKSKFDFDKSYSEAKSQLSQLELEMSPDGFKDYLRGNTDIKDIVEYATSKEREQLKQANIEKVKYLRNTPQWFKANIETEKVSQNLLEKKKKIANSLYNQKKLYDEKIESTPKEITYTNTTATGDEKTLLGKNTPQLLDNIKSGVVTMLDNTGALFNLEEQFAGYDPSKIKLKPLRDFVGGKPAYLITALGDDKKTSKSSIVTLANDDYELSTYSATGDDLIEMSQNPKYKGDAKKTLETGLLYKGYSFAGKNIQDAKIDILPPGSSTPITEDGNVVVNTKGTDFKKYYTLSIKGKELTDESGKPKAFSNEQTILTEIAKILYNIK